MLSFRLRCWMLITFVGVLSLTVTLAVSAATEDAAPAPSTATTAAAPAVTAGYSSPNGIVSPTTPFHDAMTAKYDYAFGKDTPFLMSNATTSNGQFIDPKDFPTAQYCGHCHEAAYRQWRESIHSNAFREPWYTKNVDMLIAEKGVESSRHCEGCHNPVALLSGSLSKGMPEKRPFEEEGVTCSTCHSIQSVNTTGTGSYVMGVPAVLVDEKGVPIPGPVPDAEVLAHLDRHAKAVMRPLYKTPEFCAGCHKAAIPRQLDDYKWLRAFTVYDEWQGSSFSKQSPLPFYRKDSVSNCQTCHMKSEAVPSGMSEPGATNGMLMSHRWTGGNTLVPVYYKYDDQVNKVMAFLRNGPDGAGVLNVDIFGLERERPEAASNEEGMIAPLGLSSFSIAAGDTLIADVVIQNKGIGHSFIPEQRDFYEAWVDFTVKDSTGKVLSESGFLQPDGHLDPSAHSFTNRLINVKGELNSLHEIWHNRVLAYNNTIQSGRSQLVRYRFRLPKNISGKVSLTATVKYRRFNQRFADFVMDQQHYPEPITDVATQTRTLNVGANSPVLPQAGENPEWMRWNNYGISLLDALQYEASRNAFEHVAALRPDYSDAYTNMAIVEIAWERYNDARPNLAKALALLPGDPRALYYRALVERNASQVKEAIADFEAVLAKYPRSKDGLRELGFSYFQQRDYAAARIQYERLQAIDPDDLAAHYSLAIIYRRLGEKQKSSVELAKFTDQKDDPPASVYALEYLHKHPEIAAESVTWHVHDLTGDPRKTPAKIEYKYIPGAGF